MLSDGSMGFCYGEIRGKVGISKARTEFPFAVSGNNRKFDTNLAYGNYKGTLGQDPVWKRGIQIYSKE